MSIRILQEDANMYLNVQETYAGWKEERPGVDRENLYTMIQLWHL